MNTKKDNPNIKATSKKSQLRIILIVIAVLVLILQFQPEFVHILGGVAGSFGVRPTSHFCLGFGWDAEKAITTLPDSDVEFYFGRFHFRYSVNTSVLDSGREICLGQDIWFGE
jgi:hypothetical protein